MRKQPKQARAQRRVDQILDAAAQLFAEQGYEAVTTNAIANRAEVAIGSLYQFFPNKESIMEALSDRYAEGIHEALMFVPGLSITETVSRMIDGVAQFEASHTGFRPLFMTTDKASSLHHEIIGQVDAMLAYHCPTMDATRRHQTATMGVALVKGIMPTMLPPDSLPPEFVIQELKVALLAYLRAVLTREELPLCLDLQPRPSDQTT